MRSLATFVLIGLAWLSAAHVNPALGQIPKQLSYQGVLTDSLGNPLPDNTYVMVFRLYTVASAGTALWTEVKNIPVKDGIFSTYLGDTTPFPDSVTVLGRHPGGRRPRAHAARQDGLEPVQPQSRGNERLLDEGFRERATHV
jgi:hypothetical protein